MLKKLISMFRPGKGRAGEHPVWNVDEELQGVSAESLADLSEVVPDRELGMPPLPQPGRAKKERAKPKDKPGDFQIIAHASSADEISHRKVLLVGHCVEAKLGDGGAEFSDGMVRQAPRGVSGSLRNLVGGGQSALQLALDQRFFGRGKTRFAVAIDGYLHWGLANGAELTILLGGVEDAGTTYLDVLVFHRRQLQSVEERQLVGMGEQRFGIGLDILLDDLRKRYPGARVVAAGPLPDWNWPGVEYLGAKPLKKLQFAPISEKASHVGMYRGGLLLAGTGVVVWAGLVGAGWQLYSSAGRAYQIEASDPRLQAAGGLNNASLELQQHQRDFMAMRRPQEVLVQRSGETVRGIAAIPGLRIKRITFGAGAAGGEEGQISQPEVPEVPVAQPLAVQFAPGKDADVHIVVEVAGAPTPAVEQAKAVMAQMSAMTALSLRLLPGGVSEDNGMRIFTIQGNYE
ncbi:hypothetical protein [Stenotrophomonas maltophilia]|uniref:hypothetical protein n=1 Tax=Stenotrophomonas maltophilia TaxID=40324 RepID=UPI00313C715C